jgi:hypothetical protein
MKVAGIPPAPIQLISSIKKAARAVTREFLKAAISCMKGF